MATKAPNDLTVEDLERYWSIQAVAGGEGIPIWDSKRLAPSVSAYTAAPLMETLDVIVPALDRASIEAAQQQVAELDHLWGDRRLLTIDPGLLDEGQAKAGP